MEDKRTYENVKTLLILMLGVVSCILFLIIGSTQVLRGNFKVVSVKLEKDSKSMIMPNTYRYTLKNDGIEFYFVSNAVFRPGQELELK